MENRRRRIAIVGPSRYIPATPGCDDRHERLQDRGLGPIFGKGRPPLTGVLTVTGDDAVQLVRLLLVAGHNSTTSALGNCIMRIADDDRLQTRLRSDPELIASGPQISGYLRLL